MFARADYTIGWGHGRFPRSLNFLQVAKGWFEAGHCHALLGLIFVAPVLPGKFNNLYKFF